MRKWMLGAIWGFTLAQTLVPANATVLTFDGSICNGGPCSVFPSINQTYGDDATIDVQYDNNIGDSDLLGSATAGLLFWGTSFGGLSNVAHGSNSYSAAEIFLRPSAGYEVELQSLDLGGLSCITRSSVVTVTGVGSSSASPDACGTGGHIHFTFSGYSSTGIDIQFGPDAYDLGIDNISFDVRALSSGSNIDDLAVPEPSTLAVFGATLMGWAGLRRRKKKS